VVTATLLRSMIGGSNLNSAMSGKRPSRGMVAAAAGLAGQRQPGLCVPKRERGLSDAAPMDKSWSQDQVRRKLVSEIEPANSCKHATSSSPSSSLSHLPACPFQ
jgi:hypothetical protein